MGNKDVREALIRMEEDESVREGIESGDFSVVDGLELTDDEKTLVQDAASDMPDVAGFASDYLLELDGVKGESKVAVKLDAIAWKLDGISMKWQTAWIYGSKH